MAEEEAYANQDWAEGEWVESEGGEMVWVPAEGGDTVTAEAWSQGGPEDASADLPVADTSSDADVPSADPTAGVASEPGVVQDGALPTEGAES